MSPQVLVVMPVYNAAPYLARAVQSVLAQSFADWHLLAIDDGSTDDSAGILTRLAVGDRRILLERQANAGPGPVMNRALGHARSEAIPFIARMDADDVSTPHRFERQLDLLGRTPPAAACSSNCLYIDERDLTIGSSTVPLGPRWIRWELRRGLRGMVQGATIFRTEALSAVGGYRTQFRLAEEVDLFLRLADRFDLVNAPDFLYRIRLHHGSLSVANSRQTAAYALYALDCANRRRAGRPERTFELFYAQMGPLTRLRLTREVTVLRLWRASRSHGRPLTAVSAVLDPKRPLARLLRYGERRLVRLCQKT